MPKKKTKDQDPNEDGFNRFKDEDKDLEDGELDEAGLPIDDLLDDDDLLTEDDETLLTDEEEAEEESDGMNKFYGEESYY